MSDGGGVFRVVSSKSCVSFFFHFDFVVKMVRNESNARDCVLRRETPPACKTSLPWAQFAEWLCDRACVNCCLLFEVVFFFFSFLIWLYRFDGCHTNFTNLSF